MALSTAGLHISSFFKLACVKIQPPEIGKRGIRILPAQALDSDLQMLHI